MCEQCFLLLSKKFKDLSDQALKEGDDEIADGLADMSLLSFTSTQLKNTNVFNMMLGLMTLAVADQRKMLAICKTIEFAVNLVDKELDHLN